MSSFVISFTNDPKGDFGVFAKGYTRAANRLAASLLEAPRFPDYEAYPVVFLYRHALELSLKHIIYGGVALAAFRRMDDISEQLKNNHDLVDLSRTAGKVLSLLFPNDEMLGPSECHGGRNLQGLGSDRPPLGCVPISN